MFLVSNDNQQSCNILILILCGDVLSWSSNQQLFYFLLAFVHISLLPHPPLLVFHLALGYIFYVLYAEKLNLKNADEFKYLRQSNCYTISGVDDAEQFRVVMVSLWI